MIKFVHQKSDKNTLKNQCIFVDFFVNNFVFLTLRARKNHFNIKMMSETCSGTSNYHVFSNIMTLKYVTGLMWRDIAKNVWKISKKFSKGQNRHFLGVEGSASRLTTSCNNPSPKVLKMVEFEFFSHVFCNFLPCTP